jgi:hypothetical protein
MTNTNTRVITARAAYETLINQSYHIAKWKFDITEKAIYFKLIQNLSTNMYYKLKLSERNNCTFDEIWEYLDTVWAEAEIED